MLHTLGYGMTAYKNFWDYMVACSIIEGECWPNEFDMVVSILPLVHLSQRLLVGMGQIHASEHGNYKAVRIEKGSHWVTEYVSGSYSSVWAFLKKNQSMYKSKILEAFKHLELDA